MFILRNVLVWLHALGMVGMFGGLLVVQLGLPRDIRDSAAAARVGVQITSWFMLLGLLAGIALVGVLHAVMGPHAYAMVGAKLALLLVAGATSGISNRKLRAGLLDAAVTLRWVAIAALAAGALLGTFLRG